MPYAANSELPKSVRDSLSGEAQSVFRRVVNEQLASGKSESSAFAIAWTAVKNVEGGKVQKLEALDDQYSKIPFAYDGQVLGSLREDQVPKFFGALTDTEALPVKWFDLSSLTAMQNRVSTGKVEAIRNSDDATGKKPLVVINGDKRYLADGHHRAVATWLDGNEQLEAHYKDITEENNMVKLAKADEELGLVFGWAIISKLNGEEYYDTQGDYIPEEVMLKAASNYMQNGAIAKEMHFGDEKGKVVFAFPVTADIAKAMGLSSNQTGLMIAMKPDEQSNILEKFKTGKYSGFSIGGRGERIKTND